MGSLGDLGTEDRELIRSLSERHGLSEVEIVRKGLRLLAAARSALPLAPGRVLSK